MRKLSVCVGITNAAVNLGTYPIDQALIQRGKSTVKYEANTNFKPCECDLNANSCDAFCCCDSQCNKVSSLSLKFKFVDFLGFCHRMEEKQPMQGCQVYQGHLESVSTDRLSQSPRVV